MLRDMTACLRAGIIVRVGPERIPDYLANLSHVDGLDIGLEAVKRFAVEVAKPRCQ